MMVDTTPFYIQKNHNLGARRFYSSAYRAHCLKYQIVCSFYPHRIVALSGGYEGKLSDSVIAQESGLVSFLKRHELALADRAYKRSDNFIVTHKKTKHGLGAEKRAYNYLCRHYRDAIERINGRLKNWAILKQRYRPDDYFLHQQFTRVLIVILDLQLASTKPLNSQLPRVFSPAEVLRIIRIFKKNEEEILAFKYFSIIFDKIQILYQILIFSVNKTSS